MSETNTDNGRALVETVERRDLGLLNSVSSNELSKIMISRRRSSLLLSAAVEWVEDIDDGTDEIVEERLYPALSIILQKDSRVNKQNSVSYFECLRDSVDSDKHTIVRLLLKYIPFEWVLLQNIVETVVIPKLRRVDDLRAKGRFLFILQSMNIPQFNNYCKNMMLATENAVVFIMFLTILDTAGLDLLAETSTPNLVYTRHSAVLADYLVKHAKEYADVESIVSRLTGVSEEKVKPLRSNVVYPVIHSIEGPVSWHLYKYKGKNIHLFGDVHVKYDKDKKCGDDCMTISQLLTYISKRSVQEKKLSNIFIEAPMDLCGNRNGVEQACYLTDVRSDLGSSLKRDKTLCPYQPYSKYHYFDSRESTEGKALGIAHYMYLVVKYAVDTKDVLVILKTMNVLEKIFAEIDGKPDLIFSIYVDKNRGAELLRRLTGRVGIVVGDLFKKGTETHKIRWNLQNIDPEVASAIREHFHKIYLKVLNEITKMMKDWWIPAKQDIINNQNITLFDRFANQFYGSLLKLSSVFVDIYYLARFFRSMQWEPGCKLFVTYAGDAHIRSNVEFFSKLSDMRLVDSKFMIGKSKATSLITAVTGYKPIQEVYNSSFGDIFGRNLFR